MVKTEIRNTQNAMTTTMATKTLPIGSISSGTMRPQDLIPAFLRALHSVDPDTATKIWNNPDYAAVFDWIEDDETEMPEDADFLLDALFDNLNLYCPAYCTFGAHEGDGADYGVWPCIETARDSVEFVSSKDQDYPDDDFQGEWLHVSDHGNCTLYVRENGKDTEIWSVV